MKLMFDAGQPYNGGYLEQHCPACGWSSGEKEWNKNELSHCPGCGATLPEELKLHFGGLIVSKLEGNKFSLEAPWNNQSVGIDEADVPDAILFLLKHNHFYYPNQTE
jgi:hypothetical protein